MIKGIIVEGSDCSGKTTLINTLKIPLSHSGWDIVTLGHREGAQFDRYMSQYTNASKIIFDRGHFSEIVYGNLWRGENPISAWEKDFLNAYVLENFLVIFAQAPAHVLKERYHARTYGQIITDQELDIVQSHFATLLSDPRVVRYDSTEENSLNTVVSKVLDILNKQGLNEKVVKKQNNISYEKKTFILLEGPNGSGKSTLSKLLKVSMVGWGVKTLDYKEEKPFDRYLHEYSNNTEIIFDRGHFSEIVYGNIFRNGKHFSSSELALINDYVKSRGIVILCDPPVNILASRVTNTTYPKHIHESRLDQVRQEFIQTLTLSNIPFYTVDTSKKECVDRVVYEITKALPVKPYSKMGWEKPVEKMI